MQISGPEQKRPKDFSCKLDSPNFKIALSNFFVEDWQRDEYHDVLKGHQLYVGLENGAWLYEASEHGTVVRTLVRYSAGTERLIPDWYGTLNTSLRNSQDAI